MRRSSQIVNAAALAATGFILFTTHPASAAAPTQWAQPMSLDAFSRLSISVNAASEAPISGFIPQVVLGVTDEQNHSDSVVGYGSKSGAPGGYSLPKTGAPQYVVATLDSGSQAHILTYEAAQAFDFAGAGREGTKVQPVQGANGEEEFEITDSIGVYATDFSNATVAPSSGGTVTSVAAGTFKGQWNVPALVANPEDKLPNVLGSPILSQYAVNIQNTQPRHITVGGTTYRSPAVTLQDFSATLPSGYSKVTLKTSDSGPPNAPYYINYDITGADNPDTPGAWSSLLTNGGVSVTKNGNTASGQTFLLDTGAQLSLISYDTAAAAGIYNVSLENADFVVDVLGVGGDSEAPGYYLDTLSLSTQGGPITWKRVPVLVLDVADPRDPSSALPGILGTNLFNDRDLILNTNVNSTGQVYFAIGQQWMWKTNGSGSWSNAANWSAALPSGIDTQANFYGAITSAATVTVDTPFTVGSIAFDNSNRYTLAGAGTITMQVSVDQAQINVISGSHTIAAPMVLASDVVTTIVPSTASLTISGNISSSGAHGIIKAGAGTLMLSGSNTYTGATIVQAGAIELGVNARTPILTGAGGADVQSGRLIFDYAGAGNNPSTTIKNLLTTSHASGFASGQIRSSTADTTHALGWKDDAGASHVTIAYTWYGDATLDGKVDVADLGVLATHWQQSSVWSGGDFNYSGFVDVADLGLLATNWQAGVGNPLLTGGLSFAEALAALGLPNVSVPEPTALGITITALSSLLVRRQRR